MSRHVMLLVLLLPSCSAFTPVHKAVAGAPFAQKHRQLQLNRHQYPWPSSASAPSQSGLGRSVLPTTRLGNQWAVSDQFATDFYNIDSGGEECDIVTPTQCSTDMPEWINKANELQERGVGSMLLLLATAMSLTLANAGGATSAAWLAFWSTPIGPIMAGHALSPQLWINEGAMAIFFFVVGLEIKQELRQGSLSSVRKALLPCIAAAGGMITPMAVYLATAAIMGGGSLAALTVPMATDIAFAMAIFGFFRTKMPASSSVFLLTLATVDDLGAIIVLATCFASHLAPAFLGLAAVITGILGYFGRQGNTDARVYGVGGFALWWCLLRSGISADIAGVAVALCISTKAKYPGPSKEGVKAGEEEEEGEYFNERLITRLSPITNFLIMPAFALANTAVPIGGLGAAAAGAAAKAATVVPAFGIGTGLLIGKPIGIFGSTWLATKLGIAPMPPGMTKRHLAIVSMLGAIGFTMCLLLTEVAMLAEWRTIPKISILISSAIASIVSAVAMSRLPPTDSGNRGYSPA